MQYYDKIIAGRFPGRIGGLFHRQSVGINVFDKRQSLKARIHEAKSICVKVNSRS